MKANVRIFGEEYKTIIENNSDGGTIVIMKYPLNFDEGINYD